MGIYQRRPPDREEVGLKAPNMVVGEWRDVEAVEESVKVRVLVTMPRSPKLPDVV